MKTSREMAEQYIRFKLSYECGKSPEFIQDFMARLEPDLAIANNDTAALRRVMESTAGFPTSPERKAARKALGMEGY